MAARLRELLCWFGLHYDIVSRPQKVVEVLLTHRH